MNRHHLDQCSRRDLLRLLGVGATGFVTVPTTSTRKATAAVTGVSSNSPIIRTISRDVPPIALGTGATLVHENLSALIRCSFWPSAPSRPSTPSSNNPELITEEVRIAETEGVACIVGGHGYESHHFSTLRRIAETFCLHIVTAGGTGRHRVCSPAVVSKTVEQITDELVAEATAKRFGAYTEVGLSSEMIAGDLTALTSVARAHVRTGLPIFIQGAYAGKLARLPIPSETVLRQLDLFEEEEVDLSHVVIGHLCCLDQTTVRTAIRIARRGAFIGLDRVNCEAAHWDDCRLALWMQILEAGHTDKLIFASDFYRRTELKMEGGSGYAGTLSRFTQKLREAGVDDDTMCSLIVENPRRWLAFHPQSDRNPD